MIPPYARLKPYLEHFLLAVGYAVIFLGFNHYLYLIGFVAKPISATNLTLWDVDFYKSIAEHGYDRTPGQNNSGFYLLFSLLWHWLHLGIAGACALNVLFFGLGFTLLCGLLPTTTQHKLWWLSFPGIFFLFIPYTEALFFVLCTLLLWGIHRNNLWAIRISLLLLALTRASALVLLPALLVMELAGTTDAFQKWYRTIAYYFRDMVLPTLLGTAVFVLYQYQATGIWFAYFKQQSTYWERKFRWPVFPLADMNFSNQTIWLSALAMFMAACAGCFLVFGLIRAVRGHERTNKLLLLSTGYLLLMLFTLLFYNPIWGINVTSVIGARRYLLVNPFFYVFLHYITHSIKYKPIHYALVFVAATCFFAIFRSNRLVNIVINFLPSTLLLLLAMLTSNKKLQWPLTVATIINVYLQIQLFQMMLNGMFPD